MKPIEQYEKAFETFQQEQGKIFTDNLKFLFYKLKERIPKLKRFGITNGGYLILDCECELTVIDRTGRKLCVCAVLREVLEPFSDSKERPKFKDIDKVLEGLRDVEYEPIINYIKIKGNLSCFVLAFHTYKEMADISGFTDDNGIPVKDNWEV